MKKSKVLSLLLSLSLLASLVLPGALALPTRAADGQDNSGMVISKTATANTDGSYTITLEAYATGEKVISEVKEDVPTDIVLVLDQSGSMEDPIGTVTFEPYEDERTFFGTTYHTRNQDYYEVRANGDAPNLYYPLGDGAYASVSVQREQSVTPTKIVDRWNNFDYWENRYNLYARVRGEYLKVTVTRTYWNGTYKYSLPDGTEIESIDGYQGVPTFQGTDDNCLYLSSADSSQNVYTYTYTDANGVTQTIGNSTGATTVPDFTLYKRTVNQNAGGSRLNALKTAVTNFAKAVENKAAGPDGDLSTTEDNVNHRIAFVGFASGSKYGNTDYNYGNTEVFVGANQYKYGTSAQGVYTRAFQDMNTSQGQSNVSASINALDADGGTLIDLGVEMANGILNANPVPAGEKRNRVIVVFTDGQPGWSGYDGDVAQSAIDEAQLAKNNGVTVYTVGIFSGADATSAGSNSDDASTVQKSNWFMQNLSSNNGTVQTPSYYLSAADANTLNNIFQQISNQIESGGSTATLSSETVIKDIISPAFALPTGATAANITLETYQCTGKNGDAYTWSKNDTAMDAQATVNDAQVSVTGFDFKDNYVGTVTENGSVSYRGNKLVISFTVTPKDGFLGGNNVYTNTMAGIYENDSATEPVLKFERPQVNVPIGDVSVTADDQNVYLLADVTGASLKAGTTVTVGGVPLNLDPTATNYGLETWQNEFVSIDVKLLDSNGNEITTDFNDLVNDASYSVSVTVSPKTDGQNASGTAAVPKSDSDGAKIDVYKPYIVFQDSSINAGDTPNYATDNFVSVAWKHGEVTAPTTMGTAPALTYTYDPVAAPLSAESQVKVSVAMNVTDDNSQSVDITPYVSFHRNACTAENGCGFQGGAVSAMDANRVNFIVHIKTFDLTITKSGTNTIDHDGSTERQSYIFHVTGPNNFSMDIVICGDGSKTIKNLPVGTYTVTENESWSWRYDASAPSYSVTAADIQNGQATVTVVNSRSNPYWLNGGNYAHNVFGN